MITDFSAGTEATAALNIAGTENILRFAKDAGSSILSDVDTAWLLDAVTEAATALAARHTTHRTTSLERSA